VKLLPNEADVHKLIQMTTILQTLDKLSPGDTRVRAGAAINNAITVISVLLENMAHEYSSNGAIPDATQAPLSTHTNAPPVDQQRMAQATATFNRQSHSGRHSSATSDAH